MASSVGLPSGACMLASDSLRLGLAQPRAGRKKQNIPKQIKACLMVMYRSGWMNQQQFALDGPPSVDSWRARQPVPIPQVKKKFCGTASIAGLQSCRTGLEIGQDLINGFKELLRIDRLGDVAIHAGIQAAFTIALHCMCCQ